ncbi:MAG TPA: hypothetical protein VIK10_01140 [Prolixibacteraceae bacterium]
MNETTITILKAGLAAIPYVGGPINSVWSDLQGKQVQEKIERFFSITESIKTDMILIETKVNKAFTSSSDFADVVESTLQRIINERKGEKRIMFKNILLNSMMAKEVDFDKTEKFCSLLADIGTIDLMVLAVLYSPEVYNKNNGEPIKHLNPETPGIFRVFTVTKRVHIIDVLKDLFSKKSYSNDDIIDAVHFLESNRLVIPQLKTATLETNGHPIDILKNRLTPKGKEFATYLLLIQ